MIGEDLEGLTAFAGDQDGVARLGIRQSGGDGGASVGLDPYATRSAKPREQLVEDLVGVLGARVIVRDRQAVGKRFGRGGEGTSRHARGSVSRTALRPEDAMNAARRDRMQCGQGFSQGGGMPRFVHEDVEGLSLVDSVEASRKTCDGFETGDDRRYVHSSRPGHGGGGQGV